MPKNIADFLKNISTTVGYVNDEFSHAVLSHPELLKIEIPDDFENAFNKSYLTEASAKANPVIKSYFTSSALDPIDNSLVKVMDEMGFSEEDKAEIKGIKSTYQKNEAVIKKMKMMSSASTNEEDKAKFTKEVQRLNAELVRAAADKDSALKQTNEGWVNKLATSTLTAKIISQPLYTTDTLDVNDVQTLAHNKLEKALQEKKALKIFDSETLTFKLVQKDNPDLPYFEGSKQIDFDSFLTKTLADSKLLKTTTSSSEPNGKVKFAPTTRTDGDKPQTPLQKRIASSVDDDLANLQQANA